MITKPFGQDFTFTYFPPEGESFVPYASTSPLIYIFTTKPSEAAGRAGTDATATISSWTEASNPDRRYFTISAIADPQDGTLEKLYYVAINYRLKSAGQYAYDLKQFRLIVPDGKSASALPSVEFIKECDVNLSEYYDDPNIESLSKLSLAWVKALLGSRGYAWSQIENPEDLKLLIAHKTISECWKQRIGSVGDRFDRWSTSSEQTYEALYQAIKLEYDADNSRSIETTETNSAPSYTRLIR